MPDRDKMKLIQINTVCNTSTGKIMEDIQREAIRQGYDTLSLVGRRKPFADLPCERYGNAVSFWLHVALNTAFDRQGFGSVLTTRRLIERIRRESPDMIHLHNLHGYYLNLPMLFRYLHEEYTGKIFWTFHDCWPFTGHCPYFTMVNCHKWKNGCHRCPNKKRYPISLLLDASPKNYVDKKRMFSGFENLTIVVPSKWMGELVSESFMREYPVEVIPNGIDPQVFDYTEDNRLYTKYHIPRDKKILLGVANVWDQRKGLDDFLALSKVLSEDYRIVLVGLSAMQIKKLPENIIGIQRTESRKELAALYSVAEIFVNPSREESFSLVTVEAFACGTPVIVMDTSAVKELVTQENGLVIHNTKPQTYLDAIAKLEALKPDRAIVAATARKYNNRTIAERIVNLYKEKL